MALYDFIFGPAASGKSTYIYKWLSKEAMEHPNKKYFLFVPEQNTLKAQRRIVELGECHGMLNLDVLSFQLLFYRVIDELGIRKPDILDDISKSLLIRKAALDATKNGELKVYSGKMDSPGFIGQLTTLISEFWQYDISLVDIKAMSEAVGSRLLKDKLSDMEKIFTRFKSSLTDRSTIPEEIPALLLKNINRSELLNDAVIVFDGYTGFTPVQFNIIKNILPKAERVRFSITMAEGEDPYRFSRQDITDMWWLSRKNISGIIDTASSAGVLQSKEKHLYINEKKRHVNGIYIYEVGDPTDEVRYVVRDIKLGALKEGTRYRKTAIVVSDLGTYREIIKREMAAEGIPFFMDDKASAAGSPPVELLRSAFAMISGGYRYDDVMRYLKNPLITEELSDRDAVFEFDNALRKKGIRGKKAVSEFCEDTPLMEAMESVFRLEEDLKASGFMQDRVEAVAAYLRALRFEERLLEFTERLKAAGYVNEAAETKRFTDLTDELFKRVSELFKDTELPLEEFFSLIDACFISMKGSMIPETMDMVIAGDLKRTRIEDIDTLYIIGASDGLLPSEVSGGGIFTDHERMEIEAVSGSLSDGRRVELAPDDRTDSCIQNFYMYLMMNKPEKRLVISYARTGRDGKSQRPSPVIAGLQDEDIHILEKDGSVASPEDGLRELAEYIRSGRKPGRREAGLYAALKSDPETSKRTDMMLKAAFFRHGKDMLSEPAAKMLYSDVLNGSVSRLEEYENCPFGHFVKYGLRLKEREEFDIEALDIGNLFHGSLDEVFRLIRQRGMEIGDVPDDMLYEICDRAVEDNTAAYKDKKLFMTARNRFIADRVKKITKKTAWALKNQLSKGSFRTFGTETGFKYRDGQLNLSGKIDRLDYTRIGDKTLVKVIDYKTGNTKFDISMALNGLQIQLTAYMDCALKEAAKLTGNSGEILPAGMFYYNINDPVLDYAEIEKGRNDGNTIEKLSLKALRMNGAVLNDPEALGSIDLKLAEENGSVRQSEVFTQSVLLSEKGFKNLISHTRERMRQDAAEILNGNIDIRPYRYGQDTGCDHCRFKGICGFTVNTEGYGYRLVKKADAEKTIGLLEGEVTDELERGSEKSNK